MYNQKHRNIRCGPFDSQWIPKFNTNSQSDYQLLSNHMRLRLANWELWRNRFTNGKSSVIITEMSVFPGIMRSDYQGAPKVREAKRANLLNFNLTLIFSGVKMGKGFKSNTWLLTLDPEVVRRTSGQSSRYHTGSSIKSVGFENLACLQSIENKCKWWRHGCLGCGFLEIWHEKC